MLMNVKMQTIVGILTFMTMINFMLSCVEHEKSFITSDSGSKLFVQVNYQQMTKQVVSKKYITIRLTLVLLNLDISCF